MKYLLKFGYDGTMFTGYQRGNGKRSVEDSIIKVLNGYNISETLQSAARTDRNVSAAGNVIALVSEDSPEKILGILNSQIQDMFFYSFAEVAKDFNPRHNEMKHYRYTLVKPKYRIIDLRRVLSPFKGTHDFSAFSRKDERNSIRTINEIKVTKVLDVVYVDFFGKSFVWNQIRSIMGFAEHYLSANEEPPDPFSLKERFPLLSDPRPLVLMDIAYENIEFTKCFSRGKLEFELDRNYYLRIKSLIRNNIIEKITS